MRARAVVLGLALVFGMQAYKFGPTKAPVSVARKVANIAHTVHSFVASSKDQPWVTQGAAEAPSRRLTAFNNRLVGRHDDLTGDLSGHCAKEGRLSAAELATMRVLGQENFLKDLLSGPVPEWSVKDAANDGFPEGSIWVDSRE